MQMQTTSLDESFFQGAVSVEKAGECWRPWRLPHYRRHLFPAHQNSLLQKALCPSGVRLRLLTDAGSLALIFEPLPPVSGNQPNGHAFDAVIDNEVVQTVACDGGACEAVFDACGRGQRVLELWLPPAAMIDLRAIRHPAGSLLRPLPDRRPMWVTWGSSLTHCVRAASAARTWPATVARRHDLNLVNMGFGGDCHLEPLVAMVIRDLPAAMISMKLGINAVGHSLGARTYAPLVTAAVVIVREKHPHTPLALISPMASPPRETTPGATGNTLQKMRADMRAVWRALVENGDMRLYYVDGLEFFGVDDIRRHADDELHPDAEGMDLQAERFSQLVMPLLLGRA